MKIKYLFILLILLLMSLVPFINSDGSDLNQKNIIHKFQVEKHLIQVDVDPNYPCYIENGDTIVCKPIDSKIIEDWKKQINEIPATIKDPTDLTGKKEIPNPEKDKGEYTDIQKISMLSSNSIAYKKEDSKTPITKTIDLTKEYREKIDIYSLGDNQIKIGFATNVFAVSGTPLENFIINSTNGFITYSPVNSTWLYAGATLGVVQYNTDMAFPNGKNFSFSIWTNLTSFTTSGYLVSRASASGASNQMLGLQYYGGYVSFVTSNAISYPPSGSCSIANSTYLINYSQWHHIVVNSAQVSPFSGIAELWIDGVEIANRSDFCVGNDYGGFSMSSDSNYPWQLFDFSKGAFAFTHPRYSHLDEFRIYNQTLDSSDISSLYSAGRITGINNSIIGSNTDKSLVFYSPINENTGNVNNVINSSIIGINTGNTWKNDNITLTTKGYSVNISIVNITNAYVYWDNGTVLSYNMNGNYTFTFLNSQTLWILNDKNVVTNLNYPSNLLSLGDGHINFNCSSISQLGDLTNNTIYLWNSSNYLVKNITTNFIGLSNYSIFNINLTIDDTYKWTCLSYNNISQFDMPINNTFYLITNYPAINLLSPSNNLILNNGSNIYFNFTAVHSTGLSTCQLFGNFNGLFSGNYTWINPTNNTMNWTILNLNDGNYTWNVKCNTTLSNSGYAISNFSLLVDTTYPTIDNVLINTVANSQTFSFNATITDLNLASCKYSIFNSSGGYDGANINQTFICNNQVSPTTTNYNTYNITIYAIDLAGNENSTTQSFTTYQSTVLSIAGGGGGSSKVSVIAIKSPGNLTIFNELQRAVLYSRIRESCENQTSPCKISNMTNLISTLLSNQITITQKELTDFLNNFNNNELESVQVDQGDVINFNLFAGALNIGQSLLKLTPSNIDTFAIIIFSKEFKYITNSNKNLEGVSIEGELGISANLINDNSYEVILNVENTDFTFKNFQGVVTATSKDGLVAYQNVNFRVINLTNPLSWLYLSFIPLIIFSFIYRKKIIKFFNIKYI